jgi:hypothetical protein
MVMEICRLRFEETVARAYARVRWAAQVLLRNVPIAKTSRTVSRRERACGSEVLSDFPPRA